MARAAAEKDFLLVGTVVAMGEHVEVPIILQL